MAPLAPLAPAAPRPGDVAALRQAATDFEALLLQRLLAAARPEATGAQADWRAMADARVAADLARQSPLGIAALLGVPPPHRAPR
jgi:Rod binding domain-containing protein